MKKNRNYGNITVGVLALQGSVIEHEQALGRIGVNTRKVLSPEHLDGLDGIIIPGGESTTLGKLLDFFKLREPLKGAIRAGLPVFGTCAGLILLAREVVDEKPILGLMDISVRRNAYGRQIDSFAATQTVPEFSPKPIEMVFIRAPWIERVYGDASVIAEHGGHIVAARQANMLATSFHPELTKQTAVHEYFAEMCFEYAKGVKL